MRVLRLWLVLLVLLGLWVHPATAGTVTIDFEGISDLTPFTNQQPGASFLDAAVVNSSLNEAEFPPHSGVSVAFDVGGPITILFSPSALSVSGYVTYTSPLTFQGFNAASSLVASAASAFANNLAISGDAGSTPNELFSLSSAGGISKVVIAGDLNGGSFVLDDLTFEQSSTSVPEPGGIVPLLSIGLFFLARGRKLRRV